MKIRNIAINRRKKALEIETPKGALNLPFAKLSPKPNTKDPIKTAYVDAELDGRGVTYVLESGKEGSVHLDAFLEYECDPDFMRDMTLHKLTVEAMKLFKQSGLSKHELIRRLKTSPSQLYRLLDPSNYRKSIDEMLRLISVLGYRLDVKLVKEAA
jgi:hypothetical protein